MFAGIRDYKIGSSSRGFRTNMARSNHITWRFSGGVLAYDVLPDEVDQWKPSFIKSIQALSQFDLILPMDVMTKDSLGRTALQELLGWDQFVVKGKRNVDEEKVSVVTVGQRQNSSARDFFNKEEFRNLWEENWLDNILYLWCRAVFLARLHCKNVLEISNT